MENRCREDRLCDVCGAKLRLYRGGNRYRYACTNPKCFVSHIFYPHISMGSREKVIVYVAAL